MATRNDEPTIDDHLGHAPLVHRVATLIESCDRPYVLGISGGWGSGKTSFLRKLERHFEDEYRPKKKLNAKNGVHLIWFNPWHHQFETTPLVALLQEIRRHFVLSQKFFDEAKKLTDVTMHTALSMFDTLAKVANATAPAFKTGDIMKRGQEYEAEHFQTVLASQRFRDMLEATIRQVIGENGRLVVFIDDLDRCEGETAFKLLEALKLYLNTNNCIYILGVDRYHLEGNCARSLAKEDGHIQRVAAREYLGKMIQGFFVLPTPSDTRKYIAHLLDLSADQDFRKILGDFGCAVTAGAGGQIFTAAELIEILDRILPHNPRKIKAFLFSWRVYLEVVRGNALPGGVQRDWRVTLLLHYLAQFEEPLYRRVEESPGFYNDVIVPFCKSSKSDHPAFSGMELPHEFRWKGESAAESESLTPAPVETLSDPAGGGSKGEDKKGKPPFPRLFYIAPLVSELPALSVEQIRVHSPGAG